MTTLRELRWQDLETVVEMEQRLFPDDAWSAQSWWAELAARPRRAYVVAESDDGSTVLGYAGLDLAGEVADVMTIAVAPAAQGRGLGHLLTRWLVDTATEEGAESLLLEVRADNDAARTLYARHGFEQIAVRRGYYQPGAVDALVLRRLLDTGVAPSTGS